MNTKLHLMRTSEYTRVLRPLLPAEAFMPHTGQLWRIAAHLFVIATGCVGLRGASAWWQMLPCSVVMGHSLGCLGFLAHDVGHCSVTGNKLLRRGLERLLFGLNFVSATMWRRVHTQAHHSETNTANDPDRQFRLQEQTSLRSVYSRRFIPNRHTVMGSPLPWLYLIPYTLRHLITALLPGNAKLAVVPVKPTYSRSQRLRIVIDLVVIVALQTGVWHLVGARWQAFLWASPVAVCVSSSLVMSYIFTNHFLNPLCDHTDPLIGSTSVIVPKWMDWLHDNFSYHTEHHVFPGMNPRWYPEVSRLLQEHFPERYNRIPLGDAWRRLWQRDEFIEERPS